MPERNLPRYAVLIDADNVPAKYASHLIEEIASFGEPALRRVYGDWTSARLANWKKAVQGLGLVAYQETANTTGKNASDIGLVIDAMDILHSGRLDGFVLVSSDSDFTRLASRIREHGLDVIGLGERKAPTSFVKACQRFIYLENLLETPASETGEKAAKKENPTKAIPIIRRAMDNISNDEEWYPLGQLGQYIQVESPDFDTRTYGHAKLSDLLKALKVFEIKKLDGQLQVRRLD